MPIEVMVNKTYISRNLRELDSLYKKGSRNSRHPLYYSKLALIELCGWIEVTMDRIILYCARKHLRQSSSLNYVEGTVVERTSGFTYRNHFRPMLVQVIGLVKVEELEQAFDQPKFQAMQASLGNLRVERNNQAHTYLDGITQTVFAPSVINSHFQNVYNGLKDVEKCVRRLKI